MVPNDLPASTAQAAAGQRVDVWIIGLDRPQPTVSATLEKLSADERTRADAFRNEAAQRNFVLSHAALRVILERKLNLSASEIPFVTGAHGKPALAPGVAPLEFNLTHSGDLALVAVSRQAAVGIDVERQRPMPDASRIAERFFSPEESLALKEMSAPARTTAFLHLWTRKEALAKATGVGIANSLARFNVSWDDCAAVLAIDGDPQLATEWSLHAFTPAPGYVAAVAVHAPAAEFAFHNFAGP